ncbi:hypothetical protein [Roseitranquillus sediminis]|uniref:hypothetical protein n=1 Tax=Roseitranquillus sediminis TaxID=2809051 RepID=UPI001D0CAF33|nr:hypothetical protein [Roseitranquillus sediminis]MBM9594488.1 hypothetical protein [Roseitranquillus sediminis]
MFLLAFSDKQNLLEVWQPPSLPQGPRSLSGATGQPDAPHPPGVALATLADAVIVLMMIVGPVYRVLSNRTYIGKATRKGESYLGKHDATSNCDTWNKCHPILQENARAALGPTHLRH